ncbi:protein FAR1-RELATED SEQUENCE 5-like [Coffea arabica]|uniref:Protein FAR1-RELATED SEQUENCE 5-like n=1 Tax=Coffea arabica TaxID=13443 RepID=A0A6P6T148_COFAR
MESWEDEIGRRHLVEFDEEMDEESDDCEYVNPSRIEAEDDVEEEPNKEGNDEEVYEVVHNMSHYDVMTMQFETVKNAECFYLNYGKAIGFGIRRGYKKKHPDGYVRYRAWLCNREGKRDDKHIERQDRQREPKAMTRVNCKACLKIRYDLKIKKYVVSGFISEHTHRLASPESVAFMRSHRRVSDGAYAQAHTLRRIGVGASQIVKLFALQAGGYGNIGFTPKDLYNKLHSKRMEEIAGGDAEAALAYMAGKNDGDLNFYFKYQLNDEGRLIRLFWADSRSRDDYRCFGDVLVFDSTYNTNGYDFPLVVFCGVNNHYSTCIFGCALLVGEGDDAYEWAITTFLEGMNDKKPCSVVTDGDKSMRKAIQKLLPNARHRLCSWHLECNANTNVKDKAFLDAFKGCMFMNCTPDQFELKWIEMVKKFDLTSNAWVQKMHRRKELWAMAYLRGSFFAGMRSTQRCEKMNHVLKMYLTPKLKLYEHIRSFEISIAWLRHEESRNRSETEHTDLLPATKMHSLERHAAELYTRKTFLMVREEMKMQGMYCRYNGIDDGVQCIHFLEHSYLKIEYRVQYNRFTGEMRCSCLKMETQGLPCCHMFRIMLFEHLDKIPENCILKRWTRKAKECLMLEDDTSNGSIRLTEMARYAKLISRCNNLCFHAAKTLEGFRRVEDMITTETVHVKEVQLRAEKLPIQSMTPTVSKKFGVLDPPSDRQARGAVAKGKRRQQEHRMCGNCRARDGHNRRSCKMPRQPAVLHPTEPFLQAGLNSDEDGNHGSQFRSEEALNLSSHRCEQQAHRLTMMTAGWPNQNNV